jgi:hypothetical protein
MRLTPTGIAVIFAALGVCGCERHVQLKFPDTSPGAQYTCSTTTSQVERCGPRTDIDPADDNREGTVFVILPRACGGRFNEITIHDSGSSKPRVNVKCAPPENTIVLPQPTAPPPHPGPRPLPQPESPEAPPIP